MYGKCAELELCEEIFDWTKRKENNKYYNEISVWNAMMNVYARNVNCNESIQIFNKMKIETNIEPNYKTYSILLNGCSHCGDINQAKYVWNNIDNEKIKYSEDVCTAFIDCLSRKGLLNEAYDILKELENNIIIENANNMKLPWMALLSGCKKHNNKDMTNVILLY